MSGTLKSESKLTLVGEYLYSLFKGSGQLEPPIPSMDREAVKWFVDAMLPIRKSFVTADIWWIYGQWHWRKILGIADYNAVPHIDDDDFKASITQSIDGQDFSPLLRLLIARGVYKDPDLPVANVPKAVLDIVQDSWKAPFLGDAHRNLLHNIRTSYKPQPYGNTAAIVQSSGYGKSRTVDEMATLVPTIPINVREPREEDFAAFPPSDAKLLDLFKQFPSRVFDVNGLDAVGLCHFFFKTLFDEVGNAVDSIKDMPGSIAENLRSHLQENRNALYRQVFKSFNDDHVLVAATGRETETLDSLKTLLSKLAITEGTVRLVMYIDEAHTLAGIKIGDQTMYSLLIKASSHYYSQPFFVLFLSTAA